MLIALLLLGAVSGQVEESTASRYEVFAFMATRCPMARLSTGRLNALADRYPQVRFLGISVHEQDTDADIAKFGSGLHFCFRRNLGEIDRLGATRSPEVFLLVDGRVVYQGRIDDQFSPGTNRSRPTRGDLEEAIKETLAGLPVSIPRTKAEGCRISVARTASGELTFEHVGPILHARCAVCHHPGEVAPFPLMTYDDCFAWKEMIREVVGNQRMPPWHADPRYGKFANDRSLTARERELLLRWIDAGAPAGKVEPQAPEFKKTGWSIKPDVVLQVAQPFQVPAEGMLDYQEFVLNPGFENDTWIQAVEVRPGNRALVHHIAVMLRPKGAARGTIYLNELGDRFFASMVAGTGVTVWPAGVAKVVPAGWDMVLQVHYQPNGLPGVDQSTIALQLADPATVRQQIAKRVLLLPGFVLPPNAITTLTQTWTLEDDYTLYALHPHMHLRGRSMRIEIVGGETLLSVPHFDFNWQHDYVLAEPMPLKKGTVILCSAEFDNTADNPNNPDPNATVQEGLQTTDEMFQANFDITRTHENRLASRWNLFPILALLLAALIGFFFRSTRPAQFNSAS
jgi:hypothetical protein